MEQTNEPLLKLLPAKQELIVPGKLFSGKWMNHPAKALGRLEKALVEGSFRESVTSDRLSPICTQTGKPCGTGPFCVTLIFGTVCRPCWSIVSAVKTAIPPA